MRRLFEKEIKNMPDYPHEITDETKFEEEMAVNRKAYELLKEQIRRDYGKQFVALAFGRIVAVAPTFDEASAQVFKLRPQPEHFILFKGDTKPMFEPFGYPVVDAEEDYEIEG